MAKELFDKNAWRIPNDRNKDEYEGPDPDFFLDKPKMKTLEDYQRRIDLFEIYAIAQIVSGKEFRDKSENMMYSLSVNEKVRNIMRGICLPLVMPKIKSTKPDLRNELDYYLDAAKLSYKDTFPNRKFINELEDDNDKLNIVANSRYSQLIKKMRKGPVVCLYFPTCLQGYSINAARSKSQMKELPEGFALSGLDIVIAMIMYPEILGRDHKTPGLELSSLESQCGENLSFCTYVGDGIDNVKEEIELEVHDELDDFDGRFSSGLIYFGD